MKSDFRTTALALESYAVDHNQSYPLCHTFGNAVSYLGWNPTAATVTENTMGILERLSTPVAYVTNAVTRDVFKVTQRKTGASAAELMNSQPVDLADDDAAFRLNCYIYQAWGTNRVGTGTRAVFDPGAQNRARQWVLHSAGPDNTYHNLGGIIASERTVNGPILMMYDASNGTISDGSIYRSGGERYAPTPSYAFGYGLVLATDRQN